jgi:molecular chaperone GrpE
LLEKSMNDDNKEPQSKRIPGHLIGWEEAEATASPVAIETSEISARAESVATPSEVEQLATELAEWKDRALRLQAEMDNFRKFQVRRADDQIAAERERLLRAFLPVADNLARALAQADASPASLREGLNLIVQSMMHTLEMEGVKRIKALGQPFDPEYHEAITTLPSNAEASTIIEEIEPGYTLHGALLRPAKVIVAV